MRRHSLAERLNESRQHWQIGLRKTALGRFGELVEHSGSSGAGAGRCLMHDSVALEQSEMRANCVVRYPQRLPKLLDSASAPAQLGNYLPARGREEPAVPVHLMKVGGNTDFFNKSSNYLTYSISASNLRHVQTNREQHSER